MNDIEDIKKTIEPYLSDFNTAYAEATKSDISLLDEISSYVRQTSGKQIRPIFTYLSALLCGEVTKQTTRTALAIELLHTSSLLHDDVVDNSSIRRGKSTVNIKWNNKLAILSGDYFLSIILNLLCSEENVPIMALLSKVARELSEGEVLQQEKSMDFDFSEDYYYRIIRKKTASLLAACFEGGAISVRANSEQQQLLREIGECVGIAFQIKDDILDYSLDSKTGKMVGNDIRERKFTLPLIGYLNNASESEKDFVLNVLKAEDAVLELHVKEIIEKVNASKGIQYAYECVENYIEKAYLLLDRFENSEIRTLMKDVINYVKDREV